MIIHLLKHLGWLLLYGLVWSYIFSIKLQDDRTVFQTGYEYIVEKKYQDSVDDFYEKNSPEPYK